MATSTPANGEEIILFDLPSQHKGVDHLSCFSFNPWKSIVTPSPGPASPTNNPLIPARLILNYKTLPYRTHWTEYPDLAPTLTALGVPPNAPGTAFMPYSSPTIRLPHQGDVIMHSAAIAGRLEALHPTPSLRLDVGLHVEAERVVEAAAGVIWWDGLVRTQDVCLSERSRGYFARTRREVFGASLEELRAGRGGEGAWREAEREGGVLEGVRGFLTRYRRDGELPALRDFLAMSRDVG